jgi:hypothetical protein
MISFTATRYTGGLDIYAVLRYATADYSTHFRVSQAYDHSRRTEASAFRELKSRRMRFVCGGFAIAQSPPLSAN